MPHEVDLEDQTSHNEETPLLSDERSDQQHVDQKEPEKIGSGSHFWKIFWALLAIVIFTFFIKGWIDAGSDVDVSFTRT